MNIAKNASGECHIVYESSVALVGGKKNYLKDRVMKIVECDYKLDDIPYGDKVQAEMDAENINGTFITSPLKWGQWFIFNRVIENKGYYYLRAESLGKGNVIKYLVDGRDATDAELTDIFATLQKSKPNTASQGGIAKKIDVRNILFDHIISLKVKDTGEEYVRC